MLNYKIRLYYYLKQVIPRRLQLALRRELALRKWQKCAGLWPTYHLANTLPANWSGWPDGKKFALVLTHDVESAKGYERCLQLAAIEERFGFRSSFNFVAGDYAVSPAVREELTRRGFEVGIHGLYHDSSLYHSREEFLKQASRINEVLREWDAVGFRSPCMYHHLDWLHDLDIQYDASTFDIDPFEPQPDGMHTIFPFYVFNGNKNKGYVELPYTLPQDFTLFVLMRNRTIDIWKQKLAWIAGKGGMALTVTHPDYMNFRDTSSSFTEYDADLYFRFLEHVSTAYQDQYWHALPREIARYWTDYAKQSPALPLLRHPRKASGWELGVFEHGGPHTQLPVPSLPPSRHSGRAFEPESSVFEHHSGPTQPTSARHPRSASGRGPSVFDQKSSVLRSSPMNACMVAYTYYEEDNRVRRYAEALAARGDRVDAVALRHDSLPAFEVLNGVNVYRIQERTRNEKGKLAYLSRLLRFLFNSAFFISKKHLISRYDLVHVHSVPDFEVFAALVPKLTGARVILDIHDIVPEFYASKFHVDKESLAFKALKWAEKLSIGFSDHAIISNHLWEKTVVSRSVKKEKCSTFLNYPDKTIFSPSAHNSGCGKFIIMYPGSLNWHQGLDIAIKAFAVAEKDIPDAEFHIYGAGPEEQPLRSLAAEQGLTDKVLFKGSLPLHEISKVMSQASVGVVPKRNDPFGGEAFSTKIFEFMTLGVPVTVSKTRIDSYYFNDSVVRFFEPEDHLDLARSLVFLAKNENERASLSSSASAFVNDYCWDSKKSEYFTLVEALTGNGHSAKQ